MAMITKMAPGSAEDMKYIKSVKNAPKSAKGGTQRTSFTGSSDSRSSGAPNAAVMGGMKTSPGYADQAPIMADMNSAAGSMASGYVSGGPKASSISSQIKPASEDVTRGMGGTVYKDMK
tara:strand:- start:1026 stop:1382 length:357 start_codon:yes stop_codon:yes gene_type:complete